MSFLWPKSFQGFLPKPFREKGKVLTGQLTRGMTFTHVPSRFPSSLCSCHTAFCCPLNKFSELQVFSQPRAHFPHLSTWAISWSALGLAHISPSLRSSVTTALSMIVRSQDFPSLLPCLIFLYNIYYHLTYNLPIFCFFFAVSFHT